VIFVKFSVFFGMPLLIELMFPEGAVSGVSLVLALAVRASERMGARLIFFCFEPRKVDLIICFATPCVFSMVDKLVWAIALDAFCLLNFTDTNSMAPHPAIFVLGDTWVHVGASNGSDEPSDIEPSVDEGFGFRTTLGIPYVNPYNGYVGFGRDTYDSWFRG